MKIVHVEVTRTFRYEYTEEQLDRDYDYDESGLSLKQKALAAARQDDEHGDDEYIFLEMPEEIQYVGAEVIGVFDSSEYDL